MNHIILFLVMIFFLIGSIMADDIKLKDGTTIKNVTIESSNENFYFVVLENGRNSKIRRDLIYAIVKPQKSSQNQLVSNSLELYPVKSADIAYKSSGQILRNVLIMDSTEFSYSVRLIDGTRVKFRRGDVLLSNVRDTLSSIAMESPVTTDNDQGLTENIKATPVQTASSQMRNPDGERVSLHITPSVNGGSINDIKYENNFGVSLLLKIPVSPQVTISPYYSTDTYEYKMLKDASSKQMIYKVGTTLSIYF